MDGRRKSRGSFIKSKYFWESFLDIMAGFWWLIILAYLLGGFLSGCAHYPPQTLDDLGGCSVNRAAQGGC